DDARFVAGAVEQPAQAAQGTFGDVDTLALAEERRRRQGDHALVVLARLDALDDTDRHRRRLLAMADQPGDTDGRANGAPAPARGAAGRRSGHRSSAACAGR